MQAIEIKNISKQYKNNKGIFNVNISINQGEIVGFLGPNGAGKTTTIRHILGFIFASEGYVLVNGLDVKKQMPLINKSLGYLPGEISFMDEMDGYEFIKFIAKIKGIDDLSYANELIAYFELNTKGKIKKMSKGMKQKLAIVTSILHDPAILVLDEPTSGLDPLMQRKFVELIKKEKAKGKTILISSHNFEEIERTCDRVIYIKNGRIIEDTNIEMISKDKRKIYEITFKNLDDLSRFKSSGISIVEEKEHMIKIEIFDNINELFKELKNYEIVSFHEDKLSLEEMFINYYGQGDQDYV